MKRSKEARDAQTVADQERARAWTAIGLRLNPEELTALDVYRERGIVPLSRAESARALVRRALGIGKGVRR